MNKHVILAEFNEHFAYSLNRNLRRPQLNVRQHYTYTLPNTTYNECPWLIEVSSFTYRFAKFCIVQLSLFILKMSS